MKLLNRKYLYYERKNISSFTYCYSDSNNNAFGGHLNSAIISTTGEIIIEEIEGEIEREFNEEVKLNLLFD